MISGGVRSWLIRLNLLKDYALHIFATSFLSLKTSTFETRSIVFISVQKLFLFLKYSNFKILES